MQHLRKKGPEEAILLLDQEVAEMKENAPDGLSELETANSKLHPKPFSLTITKIQSKSPQKTTSAREKLFFSHKYCYFPLSL